FLGESGRHGQPGLHLHPPGRHQHHLDGQLQRLRHRRLRHQLHRVGAATFTATTGSVTFAPSSSTAKVTIDPTPNTATSPTATVILTVTPGNAYNPTGNVATGTINNDTNVSVTVSPAAVAEDGTDSLVYTFTRTSNVSNSLTINFSVGGTATLGSDYTQ